MGAAFLDDAALPAAQDDQPKWKGEHHGNCQAHFYWRARPVLFFHLAYLKVYTEFLLFEPPQVGFY